MRLRRDSVLWLGAFLGILPMIPALSTISLAGASADAAASQKPNVLFVVFDDLNTRLGCYGDPVAKSPNLDRLAARGVTFHRAYCQQPICGPSRASFMTGRRPNTLGIWSMTRYPLDCYPDIKILPEWFKEHGYTAMSVGKVFAAHSHIDKSDFFRLSKPDRRTGGARKDEFWPHDPADKPMPPNLAKDPLCENRDLPDSACFDTLSADLAIEELRDLAAKPEPFFLALGFFKPHTPYKVPKRYWDLYERDDIPAIESPDRPEGAPDLAFHVNHEIMGTGTNRRTIDAAAQREIRHGYYAAMSFADAQFGRVLDELDRLGIADDTIVVAISDNGFHLGELDTWGKMTLFRLDARVPLIIAAPMATSGGRKTSAISELVDLYPTLVDLCSLPMPEGLDGKSLVPVLRDPSARIKEAAITETPRPALYWGGGPDAEPETIGYAMHTERFTYNRWCDFKSGQPVHEELYSYSDASLESVNLTTKPAHAEDLKRQRERFDSTIRPRLQVAPLVRKPPPPVKPVALPRGVLFEQKNNGFTNGSVTVDRVALESVDEVEAGAKPKPNVLFIVSDDLKPLLGCYGVDWIKSPNIDRLASRGTVFTANYCQVSLCAPTRFSLLTGLRPDSTGVYFNPAQPHDMLRSRLPDVVTLPQHFRNHGYITHPLHKVFDGRTVDQGHDTASWSLPYGPWEMASGGLPVQGYQEPKTKKRLSEAAKQGKPAMGPPTEGCDVPDNAYHDGGVAHTAAARIREFAKDERPFFLAVGFVKPHLPFIAPKKYWDLYDRAAFPMAAYQSLPEASPHDLGFYGNSGELRAYAGVPQTGPIPEGTQRELIHGYAACVSFIDAQVGLLVGTLEESGVADNTIICLWGDHGWHLGEHGHWGKLTNYEDAARSPLIIAAPGVSGGRRVTALTEFLDVYPTHCELAGLPKPAHLEGKSLVPILRGDQAAVHEAAITQMGRRAGKDSRMGCTIRTQRYRYIEWRRADLDSDKPSFSGKVEATELYDYETDPREQQNLAANPNYEAVLAEHQALFDRLLPHLPKPDRQPASETFGRACDEAEIVGTSH